ncbi:hypothetical protein [Ruania zhangjianzhongii]|uniref:hypothetical protein n=1 Tax=Ruania zhangjianzhongii TaxID=2603206 RepID=UPI0011C6EF94|nr:hypothetical protein [Ruania zhangjianzhongii]
MRGSSGAHRGWSPPPRRGSAPSPDTGGYWVVVKPSGRRVVGLFAAIVGMLLLGAFLILLAIVGEQPRAGMTTRIASHAAGGFLILVAIYLTVIAPRTLRGSRFGYTRAAFAYVADSQDSSTIPWTDISAVTICLAENPGGRESRLPSVDIEMPAEVRAQYPQLRDFWRDDRYALPFLAYPDLLAAMEYGCRTYAGHRYRGFSR